MSALEIDETLVAALVAAQFPEWAGLPIERVRPGGWDNRTFRLGDALSVRLPSHASYVAAVEKEQRWLPWLAPRLPLPIPAPVAQGVPGCGYPWPWSVNRWLPGDAANTDNIRPHARFARDLAAFQCALYAIAADDGPPAGAHNFHRGGDLVVYDAEAREGIARLEGSIDAGLAREAWAHACASRWTAPAVWVHGDVAGGNLLVAGGVLAAVIDFGTCGVGDPACDLVIAWTLLEPAARDDYRRAIAPALERGGEAGAWARARGWALWKAVILLSGVSAGRHDPAHTRAVLDAVLAEHRASD